MRTNHKTSIPPMLSLEELYELQVKTSELLDVAGSENLKRRLWEVFRASMACEESDSLTHVERSDQLFLYEKLIEFIDGVEPLRKSMVEIRREASC